MSLAKDITTSEKLRRIAIHEAGHAVIGYAQGLSIKSISIIRLENSRGQTIYDGIHMYRLEQIPLNEAKRYLLCAMGGPAAEKIAFSTFELNGAVRDF